MLFLLVAFLGFITFAGLGLALTSPGGASAKTLKRAQAITATGGKAERMRRAKAAANEPGARRKQLLATLKEQERAQRKASVSLEAKMRQAGLDFGVRWFWIASGVLAVTVLLLMLIGMLK